MRNRGRHENRDFDEGEHPRDARGRFIDDDEAGYRRRNYESRDYGWSGESRFGGRDDREDYYGGEHWPRGGRHYSGGQFGDYPGGYTRQGAGAGYDDIGESSWRNRGRDREEDDGESDYRHWRSEQMKKLDADYDEWRTERRKKFTEEFDKWRSNRPQSTERGSKS